MPASKVHATSRRTKVEGHPGVYYRFGRDGKRQYEITFRDEHGKQRWQRIDGNLDTADDALRDIKTKLRGGVPVRPTEKTLQEVWDEWATIYLPKRKQSTATRYQRDMKNLVLPYLGERKIQRIDADELAKWIAALRSDKKGWTILGAMTPLRLTLKYGVKKRLISANPFDFLEREDRPSSDDQVEHRILTRDELVCLFGVLGDRWKLPTKTLAMTGLRISELRALQWRDLDLEAGAINVRYQLDRDDERVKLKTKGSKRVVHIPSALVHLLRTHRLATPFSAAEDFVFATPKGIPIRYDGYFKGWKAALKRAKLDDLEEGQALTFHSLRHRFGSVLIQQGRNIVFVSRQLGHASPKITLDIYAHEFGAAENAEAMRDAMQEDYGDALAA
jgi:integrase